MKSYEKLLLENKAWAAEKKEEDPQFFTRMSEEHEAEFLWIGSSDGRIPAEDITNAEPGQLYVHRNVANMVIHTDLSMLSVLQYAVEQLKVKHIVVCGNYGCSAIKAAMSHNNFGLINKWYRYVKDVYRLHRDEIDALPTQQAKEDKLVEFNVKEQVLNLAKTSIVQRAWHHEQRPLLHGWVYSPNDGLIKQLSTISPDEELDPIYRYDISQDDI